jgi:hypothetical protein
MKTLLPTIVSTAVAISAFGQGQVMFSNLDPAHGIDAPVFAGPPGSGLENVRLNSGMLGRIALLGGPVGSQPANVYGSYGTWAPGSLSMLASPVTGATWVDVGYGDTAGYAIVGIDIARVVPNVGYGQPVMLQMVAWTGNYTDWQSAYSAWTSMQSGPPQLACSKPWIVTTTQSPTDTSYPVNIGLSSFYLTGDPVPEPSALALICCSAGVLLVFQRRNRQI